MSRLNHNMAWLCYCRSKRACLEPIRWIGDDGIHRERLESLFAALRKHIISFSSSQEYIRWCELLLVSQYSMLYLYMHGERIVSMPMISIVHWSFWKQSVVGTVGQEWTRRESPTYRSGGFYHDRPSVPVYNICLIYHVFRGTLRLANTPAHSGQKSREPRIWS
jgi:hypothetical protein